MASKYAKQRETLFASEEARNESLESILARATQKDRNAISRFIHKFVEWIKSKLPNTSYSATLERLENKWLEMVKDTEVEAKENSAEDSGVRYSIGVLENGNTFVIGDRNIITASDVSGMRKQITDFFSALLQNKESIDIPTIDGDVLTITKSETAKKARDNYKTENGIRTKLSDNEFAVKLRAESHIDELAEISFGNDTKADIKSHKFAKDGFIYKTAYFQDYDGQYYRINLSVGIKDKIATVYNIGKIKGDKLPSAKLIAVVGFKPLGNLSSDNSIPKNPETIKENVADSEADIFLKSFGNISLDLKLALHYNYSIVFLLRLTEFCGAPRRNKRSYCRPSGHTYPLTDQCAHFLFVGIKKRREYVMKKIGIVMGSDSDLPIVEKAIDTLKEYGVPHEVHVYSAHRTPDSAADFARNARKNGFCAIIAAAGMAAHLAGALAANTTLPVVGIPCKSSVLDGVDALLSTVQMPSGIPVASVAINAGVNAALLCVEILAIEDNELAAKLDNKRKEAADAVLKKDADISARYKTL